METARCRAFMVSAEAGSFTRAAEQLNYTPSGVSQLVTAFENELGFALLRRISYRERKTDNACSKGVSGAGGQDRGDSF